MRGAVWGGMKIHIFNIESVNYDSIASGCKRFELGSSFRDVQLGDFLVLKETAGKAEQTSDTELVKFTGRYIRAKVCCLEEISSGLKSGWKIAGLTEVTRHISYSYDQFAKSFGD